MRRRQAYFVTCGSAERIRPGPRPATGDGGGPATSVLSRPASAHANAGGVFMPSHESTYVDHLLEWQAGQKTSASGSSVSQLKPFRKPDHVFSRSELIREVNEPGQNPKREQALAVRELSRAGAERNTQGWLARSGQQRIFSASVQASLGKLARRPMSELRSEVESIRIHSASQMEGNTDQVAQQEMRTKSESSTLTRHAGGIGPGHGNTHGSSDMPRSWRNWQRLHDLCQDADIMDEQDEESQGFVDSLYHEVTDVELDQIVQKLHKQYHDGFRSKVGGHRAKRSEISKLVFPLQNAQREYREKIRRRLGDMILVVHVVFKNRKWTCRPKKVKVKEILGWPYRYILITREQWEEFGTGTRDLYHHEWEKLQGGHKSVGEMPHVLEMLRSCQVESAIRAAKPSNFEEYPQSNWLNFTSIRERVLHNTIVQAKGRGKWFPKASLPTRTVERTESSSMNNMRLCTQICSDQPDGKERAEHERFSVSMVIEMERTSSRERELEELELDVGVGPETQIDVEKKDKNERQGDGAPSMNSHGEETGASDTAGEENEHHETARRNGTNFGFGAEKVSQITAAAELEQKSVVVEALGDGQQVHTNHPNGSKLDKISDEELTLLILKSTSNNLDFRPMDEYRDDHLASPGSEDSYPNPIEVSLEDTSFAKEESQEQSDRVGEGATGNVTGGEVMHNDAGAETIQVVSGERNGDVLEAGDSPLQLPNDAVVEPRMHVVVEGEGLSRQISANDAISVLQAGESVQVAKPVSTPAVILELNGFDIRIRITVEDMFNRKIQPPLGRIRSLNWLLQTLTQLGEDKLMSDAVHLSQHVPRCRLPVFTIDWLTRRFGRSNFCQQILADLITTMNAYETKSPEVRMYSYGLRERFNAGQLSILLNIRSYARVVSSSQDQVPLKFAQKIAAFVLDFAKEQRVEKVLQNLEAKSAQKENDKSTVSGDQSTIPIEDVLSVILSGYGSAIHEFRVLVREEYEDLLNELARGQPRDGLKGRPLGSAIPLETMVQFVSRHYRRDRQIFMPFFEHLFVKEANHVSAEKSMLDLDCIIAIDDAVDLLGIVEKF